MKDRIKTYVSSIVKYCEDIVEIQKSFNVDYEVYINNRGYQYAISFCLEQIGELAKKLRDSGFATQYPAIPWNDIAGLRNRIAHGYDTIDLEMVFDISVSDIPDLLVYGKSILLQMDDASELQVQDEREQE